MFKRCKAPNPKAPCSHIVYVLRPYSTYIGTPLRPKYLLQKYHGAFGKDRLPGPTSTLPKCREWLQMPSHTLCRGSETFCGCFRFESKEIRAIRVSLGFRV